ARYSGCFYSIECRQNLMLFFFFSSRRRHTRLVSDWSSDVCSSDLSWPGILVLEVQRHPPDGPLAGQLDQLAGLPGRRDPRDGGEIGRASCRERGGRSGGGVMFKRKGEGESTRCQGGRRADERDVSA